MKAWRERLGPLVRPAPGPPPPAPPATAAPKPKPRPGAGRYLAITVLGLKGQALEQVIEIAERQCAASGGRPLFITDGADFEPFRRRKLAVDQVVDAEARAAELPDLAWALYRRRQYALIAARWRPAAVVSFGRRPGEDCLALLGGPGSAARQR